MADPQHQQAQAYTAEGQPIAPEDTAAAVREGRGFFQRGAKVYARNPEGSLVTVAAEDAALPGYQVLSQPELQQGLLKREAETVGGLAKTAGEGLVRGATMGLLGPEQFYDSEGRARAKARVEANPNLAAGSELAGMAGATLAASALSGGTAAGGAGARLAALAGRGALTPFRAAATLGQAAEGGAAALGAGQGILGTAARLGARGLAEGALMGAGHEVSQAALEDVPLTAERLLAGAWDGAKMGGAFGAGLGVLGAGVGKAGRAIVGRMAESGDDLTKATGSWAERTMARQHLDGAKIWNKATNGGADMQRPARIGRKLLDADMPSETTAALRRSEELAGEAVGRLKQVAQVADEAGVVAQPERILATIDDQITKLKETPFGDFQTIAKRIENEIAPFRSKVTGDLAALNKEGLINSRYLRTGMRDESRAYARSAYAGVPDAKAVALGKVPSAHGKPIEPVRVELYPGEAPALGDGRHRMFAAQEAGADSIMAKIVKYDDAGNVLSETVQPVSIGGNGGGLKFSELWDLRKKLDDVVYREGAARGPAKEALEEMRDAFRKELDDTIDGAAETSGAPPELLAMWKKATEDYSDFALVKQSLKDLSNRRSKNRSISPSDYGTGSAAGMLMGILSGNPVTGLATSAVTSAAHKLIRERGAGVLAKIADRTGGVAGRMEMAGKVAALVEAPKRLATPTAVNVSQAFDTYSKALSQAQAEPAKFAERLTTATADLGLRAPELAQQVQQVMLADMAYLNDLHPQPATRKNNTITPMAKLPEFYAFNQKKAFVDAAVAIDNPLSIFEDIARGELPLDGIKALKARRPLLFGEMRTVVIKYTAQRTEELPFNRRMLLGSAFDFPADWSMLHVGEIQESLMASNDPKSKNDPTAAPSKIGTDPGANIQPGSF